MPDRTLTDHTMPLLTRITLESLDEDYQQVAERRVAEGTEDRGSSRRPRIVATAVVAAFGLLVAIAAVQTDEQSSIASASRATLVQQITDQRDKVAGLQARIVSLRERNVALQDRLDTVSDDAAAAQARQARLAAQTGFAPVTGPGIVISVDDSPQGEAVRDEDLALLVDGLWNAGAEAISINGKRLTARSALRNSGAAINLNGPPPLSPPYLVSAIGDDKTLQADLLDTSSGLTFMSLAESFGFPVDIEAEDQLTLPAAPARLMRLRSAVEGTAAQNNVKNRKETTP